MVPRIHPVVDKRIDHCIRHRKPVKTQIDMLRVLAVDDGWVVVDVEEIAVVR